MKKAMLKIDLLVSQQEEESCLRALRDTALLHLENFDPSEKPNAQAYSRIEKALASLESLTGTGDAAIGKESKTWDELLRQIETKLEERQNLAQKQGDLQKAEDHYQRWGEVNRRESKSLEARGLQIIRLESTQRAFAQYPFQEDCICLPVAKEAGRFYFAVLGPPKSLAALPFERHLVPDLSQEELRRELAVQRQALTEVEQELMALAAHKDELERALIEQRAEWQFAKALDSGPALKKSQQRYWRAWLPAEKKAELEECLEALPLAYRWSEPQSGDEVPVAFEHGAYQALFAPIMRIFQLPRYFEFDLTPFIAVFYPILFAYCLGDAGYGAILILASALAYWRFGAPQRSLALLGLVLGIATSIMGLIKSGSLFGIPLSLDSDHSLIAFLAQAVIIPDDSDFFFNAFNVALLIGLFQITVALIIALVKSWYFEGFKASLSHWGKLFIVLSVVALFLEESLALGSTAQNLLLFSLGLGVLLVMFFHDLNLRLGMRLGSSILPLFFIFTGLLGDILSYVRLFALGVTSAVLGLVVNRIAMDMVGEWYSWLWVGVFLIFGHSLNLALAGLGSFIHPLRLTFVEFYNNAQFEGGGKEYRAFKNEHSL